MDGFGFIHEKLDIKILILFVLRRLPGAVDPETLQDLCQCDEGIGYFDYSECLNELVETGHVAETEDGYAITEKGARNADAVETDLPYSVRSRALRLLEPVEERLRRAAMIRTSHTQDEKGCMVELSMEDAQGEVIRLRLLCADDAQALRMEKHFRRNAEQDYQKIVEILMQ